MLADPECIRIEPSGRVRLCLINGASATQFWIDLGALTGSVVAVDGHPVRPVRVPRIAYFDLTLVRACALFTFIADNMDAVLVHVPASGTRAPFARSPAMSDGKVHS